MPRLATKRAAVGDLAVERHGVLRLMLVALVGNHDVVDARQERRDLLGAAAFPAVMRGDVDARGSQSVAKSLILE